MGYFYTIEHFSAIRMNDRCYSMDEPWKRYGKWNKPGTNGQYCTISLILNTIIGKFIETKSRLEVLEVEGKGRMGSYCLMVTEFFFAVIKTFWKQ